MSSGEMSSGADVLAGADALAETYAKKPFRIAVFASGNGSNFQSIIDRVLAGGLDVSVDLLVCDKPDAYVIERAQAAGVPVLTFRAKDYPSRDVYERMILAELEAKRIDLVVLAGYMRIVTDVLVQPYMGRMINIHPSLLPAFPGLHAVRQALEHGVKVTGVTVHYVDGGLDSGPIIAQRSLEIREDDTEESLSDRIHPIEHELYPQVIALIRDGRVQLSEDGRRTRVRDRG